MNEEILINVTPQETRVAVIQQGVVQELHVERISGRGLVGNIYLGIVSRVLPGMQSAFIQIGLDRAAFLHVADIWEVRQNGEPQKPIEKLLHEGARLLVQVIKDPIGTKGARLSTQVSIAGRLLVYLPQEFHIGISQRIEDEAERAQLRERLQHLLPADEKGGFIIRTMAETATDKEMLSDIEYLRKIWNGIQEKAKTVSPPALLYQDLNLSTRVLRDMSNDETDRILIDSRETHQKLQAFAQDYMLNVVERIQHYSGERPLFDLYGIEDEIERALARRVPLKSGGYLIIDQTEALTTIDVNTGGFVGGRSFDDTIFKTNLEAAHVIARQLRLRNLGGIIIVDFIDMENDSHRDSVLTEFKKALSVDRTRVTVNGFTSLGLVEMTRKRTRESLAHTLCEPCPLCQGRGEVKTAQTVC
ncbi:MAG TPA: Rne/Rng family ribonuclease, partial [Burkholderiales bacterium]|nr:Rne/Rng family ribonuclease [Burkholderiales bacterium]